MKQTFGNVLVRGILKTGQSYGMRNFVFTTISSLKIVRENRSSIFDRGPKDCPPSVPNTFDNTAAEIREITQRRDTDPGHVYSRERISRPPWKFPTGQWIRSGWWAREKERGKRHEREAVTRRCRGVIGTRGQGRPGSKGLGRARECRRHPISSQRRQPSRISGSNPRS